MEGEQCLRLPRQVAQWLVGLNLVQRSSVSPLDDDTDAVVLDEQSTARFESGAAVADLLAALPGAMHIDSLFKNGNIPLARMHNWNALGEALCRGGVDLTADARARIVAGGAFPHNLGHYLSAFVLAVRRAAVRLQLCFPDTEVVADVLTSLHAALHRRPGLIKGVTGTRPAPSRTPGQPPPLASLTQANTTPLRMLTPLSPSAGPASVDALLAESTAEYLGVSPDAAALLVADSPEQIQEWLINGAAPGGPPDGAAAWLDALGARSRHVGALLARSPPALHTLLPFYAAGLRSASGPAAAAAAHAAAGLARALRALQQEVPDLYAEAHAWFVSPGGPLALLVPCLAAGSSSVAASVTAAGARSTASSGGSLPIPTGTLMDPPLAALLIDRFCRHEMRALFAVHLPAAAPDPVTRCAALAQLLRRLCERGPNLRRVFTSCGAATAAADDALAFAGASKGATLRAAALTALSALWSSFSDAIEAAPESARALLAALKSAARAGAGPSASAGDTALAVHAHGCMVSLLHALVEGSSPFAPVILKALIFSSVEHHGVEPVRDAALSALRDVVDRHPGVPVAPVVDPLARRIARLGLCLADGPLCDALAHHPRLETRHAAQLAEAVTPIACGSESVLRPMAVDILVALAVPAAQHPGGAALLSHIARTCISAFEADAGGVTDPSLAAPLLTEASHPLAMPRTTGVALLMRFAALDSPTLSDVLRPCVAAAARAAVGVDNDEPELDLVLDALNGVLRPRTRPRRSTAAASHDRGTGSGVARSSAAGWHEDADEEATLAAAVAEAQSQEALATMSGGDVYIADDDEEEEYGEQDGARGGSRRRSSVQHNDDHAAHLGATTRSILPPLSGVAPEQKAIIEADIDAARRRREAAVEHARLEYERARLASAHMRKRLAKRRDELLAKGRTPFWDRVLSPGDDGRGNVTLSSAKRTTGGSGTQQQPAWTPAGAPAHVRASARKIPKHDRGSGHETMARRSSSGTGEPWAQALVLDALNQRLAADPSTSIPEGFERVVEEEVQLYTDTVMDPPSAPYTSPQEAQPDEVSEVVTALVHELAGPVPPLGPPVARQVVRMRVIQRVHAKALPPPTPPPPVEAGEASHAATAGHGSNYTYTLSPAPPALMIERSTARVGAGRGMLSDPVLGSDGLYAFERVPARFIATAVEDILSTLAAKIAQEAENAQRDAQLRSTRAAKMDHIKGGVAGSASPDRTRASDTGMDAGALAHARGAAAVQVRLEELKAEERARREKVKATELAERDASRKKAEAARAVAEQIAAAKLARRAAADAARAQREAAAAAARQAEEFRARKKRDEDRARVAAFQAAQRAEAEARQAAAEASARAEAERKAAELQRVKRDLAAKGRGLGQAQPSKIGVAASATKRLAEMADERASDGVLDGVLEDIAPVPTPKSTRYSHVQPRLFQHFERLPYL